MGKFVISKRGSGEYQFTLNAGNGEKILSSEGYLTKMNCYNGIQSVKLHSQYDIQFDRKNASNGKKYFVLKASNGQVIGISELYETSIGRDNGIESVKRNAQNAEIYDAS